MSVEFNLSCKCVCVQDAFARVSENMNILVTIIAESCQEMFCRLIALMTMTTTCHFMGTVLVRLAAPSPVWIMPPVTGLFGGLLVFLVSLINIVATQGILCPVCAVTDVCVDGSLYAEGVG